MGKDVRNLLESIILAVLAALLVVNFVGQLYLVEGTSMHPTLENGERVVVDKMTYHFRQPYRGEIVVFRWPQDPNRKFIKRVIGLPGDEVMIRQNTVFVNRKRLDEDYINGPTYGDYGPAVVPDGHYFLLGDNRNYSDDSRFPDVGMVPRRLIIGRSVIVVWPIGETRVLKIPQPLRSIGD